MDFFITNPLADAEEEPIVPSRYDLKLYKQIDPRLKANTLNLTIPEGPVLQYATVRAEECGETVFLGYVEKDAKKPGGSKELNCFGMEATLNKKKTIPVYYSMGEVTFADIFTHQSVSGELPGILALMNLIPSGPDYSYYDASKNIVKIAGAGTDSRYGTCTFHSVERHALAQLTGVAALADLQTTDSAFYRDASDLYIRIDASENRGWQNLGGVIADGVFSNGIECGTISSPATILRGDILTKRTKIGDLLVQLAISHGFQFHVRYSETKTYIDIDDEEGRGYPDGLITLEETNAPDSPQMEYSVPRDPKVPCLNGIGLGNQAFAQTNWAWIGPWIEEDYDVENGFRDANGVLLQNTQDQYDYLLADHAWTVRRYDTPESIIMLRAGDFVKIKPYKEPVEVLSAVSIEKDETGLVILELGNRTPDYADAWQAMQDSGNAFVSMYLQESNIALSGSTTLKPSDTTHNTSPGAGIAITIPAAAFTATKLPRITAQVSLSMSNSAIKLGRCSVTSQVGANYAKFGCFPQVMIGDSLPEFDITDIVAAGSNTLTVKVLADNDIPGLAPHAAYTDHPDIAYSLTIKMYERLSPQ